MPQPAVSLPPSSLQRLELRAPPPPRETQFPKLCSWRLHLLVPPLPQRGPLRRVVEQP
jgi:hypothetical protein